MFETNVSPAMLVPMTKRLAIITRKSEDLLLRLWASVPMTQKTFKPKQTIQDEGDDSVIILSEGTAFTYAMLSNGSRLIYDHFQSGDLYGHGVSLSRSRPMAVESATHSRALFIDRQTYREFVLSRPDLEAVFDEIEAWNNACLKNRMLTISRQRPKARLAHFLLETYDHIRTGSPYHNGDISASNTFHFPYPHRVVADTLGMSPVHVSRMFTQLLNQKFIARPTRQVVEIIDQEGLRELADYRGGTFTLSGRSDNNDAQGSAFLA